MQKNQIYVVTLFVSLLFILAACDKGTTTDVGRTAPRTPFLGGSTGLTIDFERGSPPDEVTDDNTFPFDVIVRLRNDGEFDLKKDKVKASLIGILASDFGTPDDSKLRNKPAEDDLTARKRDSEGNLVEGTTSFVTFPDKGETFAFTAKLSGNQEFTFRAEVCYLYQTKAVATLCILRDLVNIRDDVICDPSQSKTAYSSGAPVQVANFRQSVLGKDKIGFSFDVVHRGNGIIFKAKEGGITDPDCPKGSRERRSKEGRVWLRVDPGNIGGTLSCTGLEGGNEGHVNLIDGRRTVSCTQDLDSDRNDFEKVVNIELDYNYLDDKETKVLVKHLVGND